MTDTTTICCPFAVAVSDHALRWAHENSSERAQAALARNRAELTLARLCLCGMDEDGRHHTTCLTADLGQSEVTAREYRKIGLLLARMPRLAEVLDTRGFAPLKLLKKLAGTVLAVEEELSGDLEPLLLEVLTPSIDKLSMPDWKGMFAQIQTAVDTVQHSARPVDLAGAPVPEDVEETVRVRRAETPDKATTIAARLSPAHAEEAHRVLATIAAVQDCDSAEAFMHLVRGTAEVSVNLHLYRSIDGGGVWMPGAGVLSAIVSEEYLAMVDSVDTVGPSASNGYAATETQRVFVAGRDGTCMFPGCTRSAFDADMDHVLNHAEGGRTCTDNLHGLCRRHHNEKTKGLWDVTRSLSGTEYWSSVGGTRVATRPTGPLRHPGVVPFSASVRRAGELRAEHNERRDTARAEVRGVVARARVVQPVVRMLKSLRVMSPEESVDDLLDSVTVREAAVAESAAKTRAQERFNSQELKVRRHRAQAVSSEPLVDPPAPSVAAADPILELVQVYLGERDPVGALRKVGGLLARVDPRWIKPWERRGRSFTDRSPVREAVARCQAARFRNKTRRASSRPRVGR